MCGDDALAARVIEELTTTYGEEVTVLLRSRDQGQGPRIAVQRAGGGAVDWSPARTLRLAAQDRLYVIATRAGLSRVLAGSQAPRGPLHSP